MWSKFAIMMWREDHSLYEIAQRRNIRWLMNGHLDRIWNEPMVILPRYYSGITISFIVIITITN
jgi:hypothetical protein